MILTKNPTTTNKWHGRQRFKPPPDLGFNPWMAIGLTIVLLFSTPVFGVEQLKEGTNEFHFKSNVLRGSTGESGLLNKEGRNLSKEAGVKTHFSCTSDSIEFLFNETVPYTDEMQKLGEALFDFADGCPKTQACLILNDAEVWNARLAALGTAYPIFENFNLPEASPIDGYEIIENAGVLFGDSSVLHVHGVTQMTGPSAIGSYLGVPHSKVSGIVKTSDISKTFKITGVNRVEVLTNRREEWVHNNSSASFPLWGTTLTYYPCTTKIKSFVLQFPDSTAENFVKSSQVPDMMEQVCNRLQMHCTGQHQQFESFDDCMTYMKALPALDPICQDRIGPLAVQGNCFMCKYLHQFMTPFDPDYHCYHSGKGLTDSKGTRKCVPTDCLDSSTPSALTQNLLFLPGEVTAETYFKNENGTFVETLVEPEKSRDVYNKGDVCKDEEANNIAAATILSLPMCIPSLSSGIVSAPCSQAVASYLGRFAEDGSLCRCKDQIFNISVMLTALQIDAEVLIQLAYQTLTDTVKIPACINAFEMDKCSQPGEYIGKNGCQKWSFSTLEMEVYHDWSQSAAMYGRITKDDLVASAECSILSAWQRTVYSAELYYVRTEAREPVFYNFPTDFIQVHPSLGPWERTHNGVLEAMQMDQIRTIDTNGANNCWIGTNVMVLPSIRDKSDENSRRLLLPVSYSTGTSMHRKSRKIQYELLPGMLANKQDISLTNMLENVAALHNFTRKDLPFLGIIDIRKLIREVTFRALMLDEVPYDSEKLGNDLEFLELSGGIFLNSQLSSLQGEFRAVAYKSASYQIQRILQESGAWTVDEMTRALQASGLDDLLSATGPGNAYRVISPLFDTALFSMFIDRLRFDECEAKYLIDISGFHSFMLEHLRLSDFISFKAKVGDDSVARTYQVASANKDHSVFSDPLHFDSQRPNLNQVLYFNGLQKDFEEYTSETGFFNTSLQNSLKRGCPGRHISMRVLKELAPLFFPQETSEYSCHAGMRARYGVKFVSSLVRVRSGVELEVLKVNGKDKGKNLMILLHGLVDHPLGWSKFIEKIEGQQRRNSLDYWAVVMPGWGGKGSPLDQCDWPLIGGYIADLLNQAKGSYDRIFLFGRGDGGYVAQYAAHEAGKDVLHGLITDALPPALYAAAKMSKPLNRLDKMLLDPVISDTVLTSDVFPLEGLVENATWWNDAWEWEFRSFWRKTGGKQMTCQIQSNWAVGEDGMPSFNDWDAARKLDPNMHMLTISHELDMLKPEALMKYGLKQTNVRPGKVHRFEQVRDKPDLMAHFYEDKPTEELAGLVSSFVDQSIEIKYSVWSLLPKPPNFEESAYKDDATGNTVVLYCYMLTFVIMLTGIIMEVTIGPFLVGKLGFAVFLFSQVMSATITFGCFFAADLITLPLYTIGLFKLGYPEITSLVAAPLLHPEFFYHSTFYRGLSFVSGIAYIIHHSGASLVYMVVSLHEMDPLSVGFLALAVGFQHLSVFVKYVAPNVYSILLVGLEIWFQLESYYTLTYATTTAKVGICMLLMSHYIWFIHGIVDSIYEFMEKAIEEDNKEDEDGAAHRRASMIRQNTLMLFRRVTMTTGANADDADDEDGGDETTQHKEGGSSSRKLNRRTRDHKSYALLPMSRVQSMLGFDHDDFDSESSNDKEVESSEQASPPAVSFADDRD